MARSRGQQAYFEWQQEFRQAAQDFRTAQTTYVFTTESLDRYLEQYITELVARFTDENLPNAYYWEERARAYKEDLADALMTKYGLTDGDIGAIKDESGYEYTTRGVEYFGIKILTPDELETAIGNGATVRSQVFPTIADVISYLEDIPADYIAGLEAIVNNGVVEGFRVWVYPLLR